MKLKLSVALTVICLSLPLVGRADLWKELKKAERKTEKLINPNRGSNRNNSNSQSQEPTYDKLNGIDIQLISCEKWGDGAIIRFTLTNNTGVDQNLLFTYTGDPVDYTKPEPVIIDDLNNVYNGGPVKIGGDEFIQVLGYLTANVPAGITVKGVYEIKNLAPNSKSFNKITIGGVDKNSRTPFEYVFSNIPITETANTNSDNVTCNLPTMFVTYKGMERVGNNLVVTFTLKNETNNEIDGFAFHSHLAISNYSSDGDTFKAKFSDNASSNYYANFPPNVPVKCTITLYDVPASVTSFSLIRLNFLDGYKIEFKNISL